MRTAIESIFSVIGGEAAVRAATFVAALFIARVYGGTALGAYAASLSVISIFVMLADNGLQTFAIKELSEVAPSARNEIVGQIYVYKTILFAAAVLILAALAVRLKLTALVLTIAVWVTLRALLQSYSQLQMAILKAVGKARLIVFIQIVHSIFLLAGIGLAYARGWNIFALLGWFTAGQFSELLMTVGVLRVAGVCPGWPAGIHFWTAMRKSTPFGITYGLANLIVRADTVVLAAFVPLAVLGAFSAANSVLLIVYVAAWLLASVLLPEMVRLRSSAAALRAYMGKWTRLLLASSIPCAFIVFLMAPRMMSVLFGEAFYRSGAYASVMAWACPLVLLNSVFTSYAIATDRRSVFTGIYAATAVLAVALDYLFGRAFGPMGIAVAIVVREALMLAGFWIFLSRAGVPGVQLSVSVSS